MIEIAFILSHVLFIYDNHFYYWFLGMLKLPTLSLLCLLLITLSNAENFETSSHASLSTYRQMVYGQTQAQIDKFNSLYGEYYTAGHNQFSHLTLEEWKQQYLGGSMSEEGSPQRKFVGQPTAEQRQNLKKQPTLNGSKESKLLKGLKVNAQGLINGILPNNGVFSIDYSLPGNLAITPVKNQGACGSCWAFAGIGQIESFFMARHRMSLDLSEQQMVDCVTALIPQTLGCGGGQMDSVAYYAAQFPIATEKYYPYTGKGANCNKDRIAQSGGYRINSYTYVNGCQQMTSTILNLRPFAVCGMVDDQWKTYKAGVLTSCNEGTGGGHCVMLVGVYSDGTTNVNTNYFKYKNSWGVGWGMKGFVNLYRDPADQKGLCNLCSGIYTV